jgi:uncharacterized membrane protein YdbT with pleckstrin-like domain
MARSLFQKPRATGFQGRYDAFEDAGDFRQRRYNFDFEQRRAAPRSWFSRLPLIVKIIVILMVAAAALLIGSIMWLVIGALML